MSFIRMNVWRMQFVMHRILLNAVESLANSKLFIFCFISFNERVSRNITNIKMQIKIHYFCSLPGLISKAKPKPLDTYIYIKYEVCSLKSGSHYISILRMCYNVGLMGIACLCVMYTFFTHISTHISTHILL